MSISKVIGIIEEHRGVNSARIKVVSYQNNGEFIKNPIEIKNHFPPNGFVFAPNFFERFDHSLDSLIEFSISSVSSNKEDSVLLDIHKDCKSVGFQVFVITDNILINEFSINQPILKNFIQEESSHFYIKSNNALYGPFKNSNGNIIPTAGKEVNKWRPTPTEFQSGDKVFLLAKPTDVIAKIDCMTSSQLGEWLKKQIRNEQLNIDFNLLQKALESQELEGLDKARMNRALSDVRQLSLNVSELKILANSSENLNTLYVDALNKANKELKDELVEPFVQKKAKLEADIFKLEQTIKKAKKEEADTLKKLEVTTKENNFILKEKDRLIEDIRVHAFIHGLDTLNSEKLKTYEERLYMAEEDNPYNDLNEFITINNAVDGSQKGENRFFYNAILQFKDYRCFLSDKIEPIIQVAESSKNCKILIQQVEPDWLKFEFLYENGLKQIWKSSHDHSDMLHFFILEDINMASLECYGRPVLDLLSGVRVKLPGLSLSWPKNLWIFGIPLSIDDDYKFGVPLIKNTFRNWGAFAKTESPLAYKQIKSNKFLQIEKLFDHDIIIPPSLNDYFP